MQTVLDERIEALLADAPGFWRRDACGVTRGEREIPVLRHGAERPPAGERLHLVLVGGLSGEREDTEAALAALNAYRGAPGLPARFALSAVPCGNPDGLALGVAPGNGAGGTPSGGYPPAGESYYDANPEAHYLWRWVSFQGPDLVLEIRAGGAAKWEASAPCLELLSQLRSALNATELPSDGSLLGALAEGEPNRLPPVLGLRLTCATAEVEGELAKLWTVLARVPDHARSPTRGALQARAARTPVEVARILAAVYGHELEPVIYTQGVAVSGRMRLAELDSESADPAAEIAAMVAPYMSGERAWFTEGGDGGANLAGLVWADELAASTGDGRYAEALVRTADRYRATGGVGVPAPSHPDYQVEDMFFSAAVLGRAFKLTGDDDYPKILARFLLEAGVQQPDGLFWHDRRTPFYWGRGNGFAALSFAETLTYLPEGHAARAELLAVHRRQLEALRAYQHGSGMWHQVIDAPGSYLEFSVTCMVGYALARGLRLGWLDADFRETLTRAWQGVAARIDDGGGLVDVCTGTGVQQNLRGYLDRPAIFGLDERGGALSLWFVTEMESYLRDC